FQQWLLRSPEAYDVAVTTNVFGDIATDLAAVLQGGLGMAAGGNIGDEHAMFEPIHGSAPKHAGKDEVNPIAMIFAVQMMLDWLGRKKGDESMREAATAIEQGVETTLKKGTVLTYDLGGSAKCSEVGTDIGGRFQSEQPLDQEGGIGCRKKLSEFSPHWWESGEGVVQR